MIFIKDVDSSPFTWPILEYHDIKLNNKEMTLSKGNKTFCYVCVMTFLLANNHNILVGGLSKDTARVIEIYKK